MGCLANTKGIPVISSKSDLGLVVGAAGPLPLQGAASGAEGSAKAPAVPVAPVAIVTCSIAPYRKNEIDKFCQDTIFR